MSRTYRSSSAFAEGKTQEPMANDNKWHRLQSMTTALAGVFFFFAIIGVFGLSLAIAGLAVFVIGALVVYVAFPTEVA